MARLSLKLNSSTVANGLLISVVIAIIIALVMRANTLADDTFRQQIQTQVALISVDIVSKRDLSSKLNRMRSEAIDSLNWFHAQAPTDPKTGVKTEYEMPDVVFWRTDEAIPSEWSYELLARVSLGAFDRIVTNRVSSIESNLRQRIRAGFPTNERVRITSGLANDDEVRFSLEPESASIPDTQWAYFPLNGGAPNSERFNPDKFRAVAIWGISNSKNAGEYVSQRGRQRVMGATEVEVKLVTMKWPSKTVTAVFKCWGYPTTREASMDQRDEVSEEPTIAAIKQCAGLSRASAKRIQYLSFWAVPGNHVIKLPGASTIAQSELIDIRTLTVPSSASGINNVR